MVCTNGLIVSLGDFPSFRVAHRGNVVDEVVSSAVDISERFGVLASRVERMEQTFLPKEDQIAFAGRALAVRFHDPSQCGILPVQLLSCRRVDDLGNDLWSILNKVQLCGAPHNCIMCSNELCGASAIDCGRIALTRSSAAHNLGHGEQRTNQSKGLAMQSASIQESQRVGGLRIGQPVNSGVQQTSCVITHMG